VSGLGLIAQAPEPQQFATSLVEALLKVNELKACKDSREAIKIASTVEYRHDFVLEAVLLQREEQFSLHRSLGSALKRINDLQKPFLLPPSIPETDHR
jgi:hypothetical protein